MRRFTGTRTPRVERIHIYLYCTVSDGQVTVDSIMTAVLLWELQLQKARSNRHCMVCLLISKHKRHLYALLLSYLHMLILYVSRQADELLGNRTSYLPTAQRESQYVRAERRQSGQICAGCSWFYKKRVTLTKKCFNFNSTLHARTVVCVI
jgi:hypothetical protein